MDNGFVERLAQEIRSVHGSHSLGASALAEALAPFVEREAASALRSSGEAKIVRFINIYDPEFCEMGQEEFVHSTAEQAAKHLNPGGRTVRFISSDTTTPASAWRPIAEAQPPAGRMDLWLVSDDNGDYLALARRSSQGWRVDGAGDWKLPFTPTQYCKPPAPPTICEDSPKGESTKGG